MLSSFLRESQHTDYLTLDIIKPINMTDIKRSDLYYKDYLWQAAPGDDPSKAGKIDRALLSRKEGYEVLHFIKHYMQTHALSGKATANKIERMLREEVPSNLLSREHIQQWIEKHWKESKF